MTKQINQSNKYQEPQDFFTSISFSQLMGELTQKENIMQNFDTIDKQIFQKKNHNYNTKPIQINSYYQINQFTKGIKLSSQIDKIWNSKHNPDFINKIFS